MKKLAIILAVVMLVGVMPAVQVFATDVDITDTTTVTESAIFEAWGGAKSEKKIVFDETFGANEAAMLAQEKITKTGTVTYTATGAKLNSTGDNLQWNRTADAWYPMTDGVVAIRVDAKFLGTGQATIQVGYNNEYCASLALNQAMSKISTGPGKWDYVNLTPSTKKDGAAWSGWNDPANATNDSELMLSYLMVPSGAGYKVYMRGSRDTAGEWVYLTTTETGSFGNAITGISVYGPILLQSIEVLRPNLPLYTMKDLTKQETYDAVTLTVEEDFATEYDIAGINPEGIATSGTVNFTADGAVMESGSSFLWNRESDWNAFKEATPLRFRLKLDAGQAVSIKAAHTRGNTQIDLTPDSITIQDAGGATVPNSFKPGTGWVEYLLLTEDDASYQLYAKWDSSGMDVWTPIGTTSGFPFGGSLTGVEISGACTLQTLEQIQLFRRELMTDPTYIRGQENLIFLNEDFSEESNLWVLEEGWKVENGILKARSNAQGTVGGNRAYIPTGGMNPGGTFNVKFKFRVNDAWQNVNFLMWKDNTRNRYAIARDHIWNVGGTTTSLPNFELNAWYEMMICRTGDTVHDTYYRKVGDDVWTTVFKNGPIEAQNNADPFLAWTLDDAVVSQDFDDVMIWKDSLINIDPLKVEGGAATITGNMIFDKPDSQYNRQVEILLVAYNKEYGYIEEVYSEPYIIAPGEELVINKNIDLSSIDLAKNDLGLLVWDSSQSGIPLLQPQGYMVPNKATGKPAEGAEIALATVTNYNEVKISGYTGLIGENVTAVLVDDTGKTCAVAQTLTNEHGMLDMTLAVKPSSKSGNYTLRLQCGDNAATESQVELFCDSIPYDEITGVSAMDSFLRNYGSSNLASWLSKDGFVKEVYDSYDALTNSGATITDFYSFRTAIDDAVQKATDEFDLIEKLNSAVVNKKWNTIQSLLMTTYREHIGIPEDAINDIQDLKTLFLRLAGNYADSAEILADINQALSAQKTLEGMNNNFGGTGSGPVSGGFAGGGVAGGTGGGGYSGGGAVSIEQKNDGASNLPELETIIPFQDLETVSWAKDSIENLQLHRIISGDGDGKFYPDRAIVREEFLKLAMLAAGISADQTALMPFADVEDGAWYRDYVAAAYQNGIVKGINETNFGIGAEISRSDMAVMLIRILDACGIELELVRPAKVFDDFSEIPEYAQESVALLYEAGLMNGVGESWFGADSNATRAEAATAIDRVYRYIVERR